MGLIVAGFADSRRAHSPDPLDLPGLAAAAGAQGCLVDTAVKDGRGLLDWLDEAALRALRAACRARGLSCGLAGSLKAVDLPRIAAALKVADRGYVLEMGRNALDGSGPALLDDPRVQELYLGGGRGWAE